MFLTNIRKTMSNSKHRAKIKIDTISQQTDVLVFQDNNIYYVESGGPRSGPEDSFSKENGPHKM